jgi:CheY-like chemotaxis protein
VIRVRDNGIGIEPSMLAHVFDPFAQDGQAIERSRGGLGLGLTIVRNLVSMHGGTVEVTSEGKGRGSEFVVQLPAADEPSEPVITTVMAPGARSTFLDPDAAPVPNVLRGRKILVVEDNADAAELLAEWFRGKGADVLTALDGDSALRRASEYRPELGVIDIGLPGIDGYELARRLRQDPLHKRLLLVAVTGYGQDSDRERSAESGFDAHLVKPLDLSHFEPLLREWL